MNSKVQCLSGERSVAREKYELILHMLTSLGSHWPHMSIYCVLIVKLGICPSRGY